MIDGLSQRLSDGDLAMVGEAMTMRMSREAGLRAAAAQEYVQRVVPERMYIKRGDFQKFGYSDRCPGCRSVIVGGTQQGHSEARRKRILGELETIQDRSRRTSRRKLEETSAGSGAGAMTDVCSGGLTVADAWRVSGQGGLGGGGGETMTDVVSGGQTVAGAPVKSSGSCGGGVAVAMGLGGGAS